MEMGSPRMFTPGVRDCPPMWAVHTLMPRMPAYRADSSSFNGFTRTAGRATQVLCLNQSLLRIGIGE